MNGIWSSLPMRSFLVGRRPAASFRILRTDPITAGTASRSTKPSSSAQCPHVATWKIRSYLHHLSRAQLMGPPTPAHVGGTPTLTPEYLKTPELARHSEARHSEGCPLGHGAPTRRRDSGTTGHYITMPGAVRRQLLMNCGGMQPRGRLLRRRLAGRYGQGAWAAPCRHRQRCWSPWGAVTDCPSPVPAAAPRGPTQPRKRILSAQRAHVHPRPRLAPGTPADQGVARATVAQARAAFCKLERAGNTTGWGRRAARGGLGVSHRNQASKESVAPFCPLLSAAFSAISRSAGTPH